MELHGWQQSQTQQAPCSTGIVNLLPLSWDAFSSIYSQIQKLVSKFPYSKRLVLYFAYRGTTVKLDLGDVKAAGVACLLGLGVGLGTLFIYRLYHKYIQPFLDAQFKDPPDSPSFDHCCQHSDSSDSGVDGAMGNTSSGASSPAVYYSPQYGVALGGKALSPRQQLQIVADGVRMRRNGTRAKPVCRHPVERPSLVPQNNPDIKTGLDIKNLLDVKEVYSRDRDNRSTGSSDLSPSPLREINIRDSFYSTAESGFETLPEGNENDDEDDEGEDGLSQSLKENYSISSLRERNDRYFSALNSGTGDHGSGGDKTLADPTQDSEESNSKGDIVSVINKPKIIRPVLPSSSKSSPAHKVGTVTDARLLAAARKHGHQFGEFIDDCDRHSSLDTCESVRSFNSSCEGEEDWNWEEERDTACPFPLAHSDMTDREHHQQLMQRIHDWTQFAVNYIRSRSPTPEWPECKSPPPYIRRSRSLDRHIGEPVYVSVDIDDLSSAEPVTVEDCTIKNLECLESEFHDIQGEFESITSKLHELIHRGGEPVPAGKDHTSAATAVPPNHPSGQRHLPAGNHVRAAGPTRTVRTRWERLPSFSGRSDSSRSSRASSVEYCWDCGIGDPSLATRGKEYSRSHGCELDQDAELCHSGVSENAGPKVQNVGESLSIKDYAEQEWKGDTTKAKTIKQGYSAIPALFKCSQLRKIRGDNYCALRSTLFQLLVKGQRVTQHWPGLISIVDRLHELSLDLTSGLREWTFAGRLSWEGEEDKFSKLAHCVLTLYTVIEEMSSMQSEEERLSRTLSLLNSGERFDVELMEGMKLMMLFQANQLQQEIKQDANVPMFAWLLFARDSSADVVSFVKNHLNNVGDSAGIDQVEMCLLGQSLGVRLQVARLDHFGQEDFDVSFPDEAPADWPSVFLLAEDDRHYNVPVA